jgi:hypothetical protein
MNLFAPVKRAIARRPVAAFLLVAIGVLLVTAAIPPPTATDIPPFPRDSALGQRGRSSSEALSLSPEKGAARMDAVTADIVTHTAIRHRGAPRSEPYSSAQRTSRVARDLALLGPVHL